MWTLPRNFNLIKKTNQIISSLKNDWKWWLKFIYIIIINSLLIVLSGELRKWLCKSTCSKNLYSLFFGEVSTDEWWLLVIIVIWQILTILTLVWFMVIKKNNFVNFGSFLIIFGIFGNLISRTSNREYKVIDYWSLQEHISFNLEDIMIIFGLIVLIIFVIKKNQIIFKIPLIKKIISNKKLNLFKPKIIKETSDYFVIYKPADMVSHPDHHHPEGTVWNLVNHKINFNNNKGYAGMLQRLDKPTTGLLVIAKNETSYNNLQKQMKERKIIRKYYALVRSKDKFIKKEFIVDVPLDKPNRKTQKVSVSLLGKKAITHFKVIKETLNYSLLECELETGRTHQIRAHLKFLNHAIVNDRLYGKENKNWIFLHAYYLAFLDPKNNHKIVFETQLPEWFQKELKQDIIEKSN